MEIRLHELEYKIKIFIIIGLYNFVQFYYIWVIKLMEKYYLAICALGVNRMLEGIEYFFQR